MTVRVAAVGCHHMGMYFLACEAVHTKFVGMVAAVKKMPSFSLIPGVDIIFHRDEKRMGLNITKINEYDSISSAAATVPTN